MFYQADAAAAATAAAAAMAAAAAVPESATALDEGQHGVHEAAGTADSAAAVDGDGDGASGEVAAAEEVAAAASSQRLISLEKAFAGGNLAEDTYLKLKAKFMAEDDSPALAR